MLAKVIDNESKATWDRAGILHGSPKNSSSQLEKTCLSCSKIFAQSISGSAEVEWYDGAEDQGGNKGTLDNGKTIKAPWIGSHVEHLMDGDTLSMHSHLDFVIL